MVRMEANAGFYFGKVGEKRALGRFGVDGKVILKRTLKIRIGTVWTI